MSTKFYTNVRTDRGKILFRGVIDGKRVTTVIKGFKPKLYLVDRKSSTKYTTFEGDPLKEFEFSSISKARDFAKKYENNSTVSVYGNRQFEYSFVNELFGETISFDKSLIKIGTIDIETDSVSGFPYPEQAKESVLSITYHFDGIYHIWGLKPYTNVREDVIYYEMDSEEELLKAFIRFYASDYPDILTGWNITFFDIPYLVNRTEKILGPDYAKLFSPWGKIYDRTIWDKKIRKNKNYKSLIGINDLDYMRVFQKFAHDRSQEEYSLDHIANVVLGEKKLNYSAHGTLRELYEEDFQTFIDYNMRDVELVVKMEERRRLIELIMYMAYDAGINYEDTFFETRMWSNICYFHLKTHENKIMKYDFEVKEKNEKYKGAFVKEPIPGKYNWIATMDFKSLYPSVIQTFNISPETLVRVDPCDFDNLVDKTQVIKDDDLCFCGNGARFRKDKKGLFPSLVDKYMVRRDVSKSKMQENEKLYIKTKDQKYKNLVDVYNMQQQAYKVALNALYGASGSPAFPFYDPVIAQAITISSQFITRSIMKYADEFLQNKLKGTNRSFVAYGDTDSVFFELEKVLNDFYKDKPEQKSADFIDKFVEEILRKETDKIIKDCLQYANAYSESIFLKREKIASSGIIASKKKYALNVIDNEGTRYEKPKLQITGLKAVSSETPKIVREEMKDAIRICIEGTEEELQRKVKEFREKFYTFSPEEIAISKGVSDVEKYNINSKGIPRHNRAALNYQKTLEDLNIANSYDNIGNGIKIKMLELKTPNPFGDSIIGFIGNAPKEFDLKPWIDYDKQFELTFIKGIEKVTKHIGWSHQKKNKLSSILRKGK